MKVWQSVTPAEAAIAMSRGELQVVDVREPVELVHARVVGATHIPLGQLPSRLDELNPNRPVAFLCASGQRSKKAMRAATSFGLIAGNIEGGIKAWTQAGLPVTAAISEAHA